MTEHERRLIVVESDHGAERGWARVFGALFIIVMAIGIVDHTLTVLFTTVAAWFS